MDATTQVVLATVLGVLLGAGVTYAWRASERQLHGSPAPAPEPLVPPAVSAVLSVLRSSAVLVDNNEEILTASAPAYALGLVADGRLVSHELSDLVRQVRRDGQIRDGELRLLRERGAPPLMVAVRVAPLSSQLVLVLAEDRTRERRVEAIRRDFVTNVSHELKTPVGAINLLAEAVSEASDDPEAVTRFAGRMQTESQRLTTLVQQIIELSRLQGDDPLDDPMVVLAGEVIDASVEHVCTTAQARGIEIVITGDQELEILGDADQIVMALSNLVANAVNYSPDNSRVVISAKAGEYMVELAVTDQGIGIPPEEIDRIFERFYRVDPARHRSTGGTGLGLSIVKHVTASHGGDVRVWSVEGEGSTFTLSLPGRLRAKPATPVTDPAPSPTEVIR